MNDPGEAIRVLHCSDVLCVWAYVSQVRVDELKKTFADAIDVDFRFLQVFGNTHGKLDRQWAERGGRDGYARHVRGIVSGFDHVDLHPDAWARVAPSSSMPGHLFLCAVRLLEATEAVRSGSFEDAAWAVRQAFFRDGIDIGRRDALLGIAESLGLQVEPIEAALDSGAAHAALSEDLELAGEHSLRVSPSLVFNEGRQRLIGNVGYRVMEANVRELLTGPSGQHSWC